MRLLFSLICVAFFVQNSLAEPQPTGKKAHCDLNSANGDHVGRIELTEVNVDGVLAVSVQAHLTKIGLDNGAKGFHIHQFGKTGNNCMDAGPHFNPYNMQHGSPLDHSNRHIGDLGNVFVMNNEAKINILDSRLILKDLKEDPLGIVGRAFVLHKLEDDLGKGNASDSKATGAAGGRHACGIINWN